MKHCLSCLIDYLSHNTNAEIFFCFQDFIPGVNVSMGPWLGIVTEVYRKVVLRIKNGSRYLWFLLHPVRHVHFL